jgi:hypothetical protein
MEKKSRVLLIVGVIFAVIVVISLAVISLETVKNRSDSLSDNSSDRLLAEASKADEISSKARGEVVDGEMISLTPLDANYTLTSPISCTPKDFLMRYPDTPKRWNEMTTCARVFMRNTHYFSKLKIAEQSVRSIEEKIPVVEKTLREVLPIKKIEDLPPGGTIPTGEIDYLPLEGADLSVQCVKDRSGQVVWSATLAGDYFKAYTKAAFYQVPFTEKTRRQLEEILKDGEVSVSEGQSVMSKFTFISANSFSRKPFDYEPFSISRNEKADKFAVGVKVCSGYDIQGPMGVSNTSCLPFDPLGMIKNSIKDRLEELNRMKNSFLTQANTYRQQISKLKKDYPSCFGAN